MPTEPLNICRRWSRTGVSITSSPLRSNYPLPRALVMSHNLLQGLRGRDGIAADWHRAANGETSSTVASSARRSFLHDSLQKRAVGLLSNDSKQANESGIVWPTRLPLQRLIKRLECFKRLIASASHLRSQNLKPLALNPQILLHTPTWQARGRSQRLRQDGILAFLLGDVRLP